MKMKSSLLALSLLGILFQAQGECPACENYLYELGVVLFSEENFAFQVEYITSLFCDDGDEACAAFVQEDYPKFWQVIFGINDLNSGLCTFMGADDNCGDWESSTSSVDICIARSTDFAALIENDAFDDFVDFLASEDGYCGNVFCENSDDPECLEQCYETEQEAVPKTFNGLLEKLELGIQGICEEVVSN